MISIFDFMIEGHLFKSTKSTDFIVDLSLEPLFNKHKAVITDDYWDENNSQFKGLIDVAFPYFWSCFTPSGDLFGFIFLLDWKSSGTVCDFHIVIEEKYQGTMVKKLAIKTACELFNKFNIKRIACTIPCYNRKAIAFASKILGAKFEGTLRSFSKKNNKPLDYLVYGLLNSDIKGDN